MSQRTQLIKKTVRRERRKHHVRRRVFGTAEAPRLTVTRSHNHIYCQLVDDVRGVTLASASTRDKELRGAVQGHGGNRAAATMVGKGIAERCKALGITRCRFDRNGYRYHGRVKALVEAARESGLTV